MVSCLSVARQLAEEAVMCFLMAYRGCKLTSSCCIVRTNRVANAFGSRSFVLSGSAVGWVVVAAAVGGWVVVAAAAGGWVGVGSAAGGWVGVGSAAGGWGVGGSAAGGWGVGGSAARGWGVVGGCARTVGAAMMRTVRECRKATRGERGRLRFARRPAYLAASMG